MTKKNLTDREVKSVYNTPSKGDGYRICHLDAGGTLHLVVSRAVDGGINRAWVVRLTLNGQRTKKGIGTWSEIGSIREAKAMAEKFVAALMTTGEDIRKPALVAKTAPAARTPTFGELFPKWIDSVERQKGGVGEIPKRIEGRMMKHVMPALGKLTPEELTPKRECLDFCVQGGFQGGSQSRLSFVYRGLKINDQRLRGTLSRRQKCAKRHAEGSIIPCIIPSRW